MVQAISVRWKKDPAGQSSLQKFPSGARAVHRFTNGALDSMKAFNQQNPAGDTYSVRCWTFEDNFFEEKLSPSFGNYVTERQENKAAKELLTDILQQLQSPQRGLVKFE